MNYLSLTFLFVLFGALSSVFGQSNAPQTTVEDTTKRNARYTGDGIFDIIEEEPVFPGGDEAMQQFIRDNLVYPAEAKEKGEQGKVYVRFVVEADGTITNVVIARGVSPSIDAEALRIVKLMPNWNPGMYKGTPVLTNVVIPIVFKL